MNRNWDSRWYADTRDYGALLLEDIKIRALIQEECRPAGISRVVIERPHRKCRITIHAGRPGHILGEGGANLDALRKKIATHTKSAIILNVVEVEKPALDAQLVAESVAQQIERRVSYRRAVKRAVQTAMRSGALGVRVEVIREISGSQKARSEWFREGRIPLHTLRADIGYANVQAKGAHGTVVIKLWIFKGEFTDDEPNVPGRQRKGTSSFDGDLPGRHRAASSKAAASDPGALQTEVAEDVDMVRGRLVSALTGGAAEPGEALTLDRLVSISGRKSPDTTFLTALTQICTSANPILKLTGHLTDRSSVALPQSDLWDALTGQGHDPETISVRFVYRQQ